MTLQQLIDELIEISNTSELGGTMEVYMWKMCGPSYDAYEKPMPLTQISVEIDSRTQLAKLELDAEEE